ncbi:MAG: hypothetical protein SGJ15_03310 [Bacteroidota bacterium]|nr:hypothetical protein [Bacteroidota bacterium]
MKKYYLNSFLFASLFVVMLISCKKDEPVPPNPFDDPSLDPPPATPSGYNPSPTSFEYIYDKIFNKTCNNSGCHDGTFEPDFRNISSSYNSLVYAPITNNPNTSNYNFRVQPGDASKSVLISRLVQIPGKTVGSTLTFGQGRMPWNDTTWKFSAQNSTYIQNITDWINAGAKDVFGNPAIQGNKNPNTMGLQITNTGNSTAFQRPKFISISKSNGPIDVWCYVVDDNTLPQNMVSAEIKFSLNRFDFSSAVTQTLSYTSSGNSYLDMPLDNTVQYNYKLTSFNLNTVLNDTGYIFIRTYIRDTDHATPSETPNNGSLYYTDYFILKITP